MSLTDRVQSALTDAQRLVIESYRSRALARYVLFEVIDLPAARANLATMIRLNWIQSAQRELKRVDEKKELERPLRINISFTMHGLKQFGLDQSALHNLPLAFAEGMAATDKARLLNDDLSQWGWSDANPRIHGMMLVFCNGTFADQISRDEDGNSDYNPEPLLDAAWDQIKARCVGDPDGIERFGFDVVHKLPAGWLRDDLKGHFGFKDGISQPYIDGTETSIKPQGKFADVHTIKPGEILLGYQNESGSSVPPLWVENPNLESQPWFDWLESESVGPNRKDFGRNGSYLAFRQMEQKVGQFDHFLNEQALARISNDAGVRLLSWKSNEQRGLDEIRRFDQFLADISEISIDAVLRPINEAMLLAFDGLESRVRARLKYHWIDNDLALLLLCQLSPDTCEYIDSKFADPRIFKDKLDLYGDAKDLRESALARIAATQPWKARIDQLAKDLQLLGSERDRKLRNDAGARLALIEFDDDIRWIHRHFLESAQINRIDLTTAANIDSPVGELSIIEALHAGLLPLVMKEFQRFYQHKEKIAAKFIGRWRSGAPLVRSPETDSPWLDEENDFVYLPEDKHGFRCPIGSHIRRSNPRDGLEDERLGITAKKSMSRSRRARIIRRGRPYILDQHNVGIHFIALNASLRDQFEFILTNWVNNTEFGGLTNEVDPLMGKMRGDKASRSFTVQNAPLSERYSGLNDFVQVRGGGYFFLPGIKALKFLARMPAPKPEPTASALVAQLGKP